MVVFGPLEFWFPDPNRTKRSPDASKHEPDYTKYKALFQWTQADYELEQRWTYEAWQRQNRTKEESYHYRYDHDDNWDIIDDPIPAGIIGYESVGDSVLDGVKRFRDEKKRRKPITKQIKIRLVEQRGGMCESCKEEIFHQVHHIDGDAENNQESNLMLVCIDCHKELEKNKHRR